MVEKPQDVKLEKIYEFDSPEELCCFDDPEPGDYLKMPKVTKPSPATYNKKTYEEIQLELQEMRKKLGIT